MVSSDFSFDFLRRAPAVVGRSINKVSKTATDVTNDFRMLQIP
jgi:hypothetical protein